jgi:copper oxidase (laccase) domain-containing protein
MQQVHGSRIGVVKRPQLRARTDGLITKTPELWLVVSHADCIPLFYIDEEVAGKFKLPESFQPKSPS